MKLLSISKPYSWLQWPVIVSGLHSENPHITAKFFGRAPISPTAVERMLKSSSRSNFLPAQGFVWKPVIFNDIVHVLELTTFPGHMRDTHELFSLLRDDFEPYRPHITVPAEFWHHVRDKKIQASQAILEVKPLELYLGTGEDADA